MRWACLQCDKGLAYDISFKFKVEKKGNSKDHVVESFVLCRECLKKLGLNLSIEYERPKSPEMFEVVD